ncbi:MAG: hypothetical protein V4463_06015, partial [Pseudomonadota bacterium]
MTNDELTKLTSGKFSYQMPYQDYLNIIYDATEKIKVSELFTSFSNSMEFAANLYGYNPPRYTQLESKPISRRVLM